MLLIKNFQIFAITTPAILPCHATRIWLNPCLPYAPGFAYLQECSTQIESHGNLLSGPIAKYYWTFSCFLLFWSVKELMANHFFVVNQLYFLVAFCLSYYLNTLLVNTSSTIPNWTLVKLYRELQLLLCYFNRINQDIFISTLLYFISIGNVIGMFAFITGRTEMSFMQFWIMGSAASQSYLCIIFGYGTFGKIFNDSYKLLKAFSAVKVSMKEQNKFYRKSVKSLQPLKVMLGSVNFVDQLTPIALIDFFLGILVNLLLLK